MGPLPRHDSQGRLVEEMGGTQGGKDAGTGRRRWPASVGVGRQRERRRIGVLRGGVEEEIVTSPSRRPPVRDEGTQVLDLPTYRSTEKYWWALLFLVLPSQK